MVGEPGERRVDFARAQWPIRWLAALVESGQVRCARCERIEADGDAQVVRGEQDLAHGVSLLTDDRKARGIGMRDGLIGDRVRWDGFVTVEQRVTREPIRGGRGE